MGGVWHFLDFSHSSKSKKQSTHNKHMDGMEAPRNSIELHFERRFGYNSIYDNTLFSHQGRHHSRMDEDSNGTPIKNLIDKEMSDRPSTSHRTPSVVARLMGMDAFPIETKPSKPPKERTNTNSRNNVGRVVYGSVGPSSYKLQDSMPIKQRNGECCPRSHSTSSPTTSRGRSSKPRPREHPQEEQLEKFKKEFEAWQSNRLWDHSKSVGLDHNLPQRREKQKPAGMINKEKMVPTMDMNLTNEKSLQPLNNNSTSTVGGEPPVTEEKKFPAADASLSDQKYQEPSNNNSTGRKLMAPNLPCEGFTHRKCQPNKPLIMTLGNRKNATGSRLSSITESDEENERSPSPTKIIILKPGFEDIDDVERTWCCSPEVTEREGSMDAFLEEVKERLRMEIQGKPRHEASLGSGRPNSFPLERPKKQCSSPEMIEREICMESFLGEVKERLRMEVQGKGRNEASTSSRRLDDFSIERPSDPKQIAQQIARQIRESVTKDVQSTIRMPESIISHDGDALSSKSDSTDSIKRGRRDLMSERFGNILGSYDGHVDFAATEGKTISAGADFKRDKFRAKTDASKQVGKSHWEDGRSLIEATTSSFGEEEKDGVALSGELLPRSLVRSLSAPASRAVVQRLPSDEQCASLGAHVPRKQPETSESTPSSATKRRRDGFNLKGRVSSLKHSLALKGKLFSKKSPPAQKSPPLESDFLHGFPTAPSVLMNVGIPQENLTEVPPSPASMSTSSLEDFGKPGQPSPISPLEVPFNRCFSPQNVKDVKDVSSKILVESPLQTMEEVEDNEANLLVDDEIVEVCDQDEAYVRDVLVRAGLYGRMSAGKEFPRWKMLCEPIPNGVFEEMEDTYKCERPDCANFLSEVPISRKLLFDLLNEALPCLLRLPSTRLDMERFERRLAELHGKKILNDAWQEILTSTQALDEEPFSLDHVIAQDLWNTPWSAMSCNAKDEITTDLESMILEQLLDEFALESCGLVAD